MISLQEKLDIITRACEDKKGTDIEVLNIGKITTIADYFVVVSSTSSNQAQAIADEIERNMDQEGIEKLSKDGYQSGRWILLDYEDVIIHVFHKEERDYYNIERLWKERIEA